MVARFRGIGRIARWELQTSSKAPGGLLAKEIMALGRSRFARLCLPSNGKDSTLDLNVNGPLESLLNLGLKSRISVGTKP